MLDRFGAVGDGELRRTLLYVRASAGAVTAAEAATALGVPRTAVRHRLERLAAAGFVTTAYERRSGRTGPGAGRPAKTYAPAVETAQLEFPPRRYELLAALMLAQLPKGEQAEGVGQAFGRELARAARLRPATRVRPALERLCRALGTLGFHASVATSSASEAVIETATCPLRPLVLAAPEARAVDQAMWRALVEAALPEASVACETAACFDRGSACRIRVTLSR